MWTCEEGETEEVGREKVVNEEMIAEQIFLPRNFRVECCSLVELSTGVFSRVMSNMFTAKIFNCPCTVFNNSTEMNCRSRP